MQVGWRMEPPKSPVKSSLLHGVWLGQGNGRMVVGGWEINRSPDPSKGCYHVTGQSTVLINRLGKQNNLFLQV